MPTEPDHLKPFLETLARAAPNSGRLDRDALLFDAGRRSANRGRFWPLTAVTLAVLSAGLAGMVTLRPPRVVEVERVVYVPAPVPEPSREPVAEVVPPSSDWIEGLALRQRVLRDGVTALSTTPWAPSAPRTDVPDFHALRLNAPAAKGDRFR